MKGKAQLLPKEAANSIDGGCSTRALVHMCRELASATLFATFALWADMAKDAFFPATAWLAGLSI